ncbi:hypothetical protein [Mesorhizobium sp. INR15]|uniref:hypothetical protein n=1 Tax=Mesorhizobium sp. INR15 TaxID=2654248 RepID=UPI0018969CD8|nr:hypothetical protein [Mesorhizobium sp. INR15]QPC95852.1 hypothetical protein GA829_35525 [Mesorhizobium sp. INR15]
MRTIDTNETGIGGFVFFLKHLSNAARRVLKATPKRGCKATTAKVTEICIPSRISNERSRRCLSMQKAAELLSLLGDHIDAVKRHIVAMDDSTLETLAASLPVKAPFATAEGLMFVLVHREIESRVRPNSQDNVLSFELARGLARKSARNTII